MKKRSIYFLFILCFTLSCSTVRNIKTRKNTKIILEQFINYSMEKYPKVSENFTDYFLYISLNHFPDSIDYLALNIELRNRKEMDSMPEEKVYSFKQTKVLLAEKSECIYQIRKIFRKEPYEDLKLSNKKAIYRDVMYWYIVLDKKNEIVRCISGPITDTSAYHILVNQGIKLSRDFKVR